MGGVTYSNIFRFRLARTGLQKCACVIRNYAGAAHWHYFELEQEAVSLFASDVVILAETLLRDELHTIEVAVVPTVIIGVAEMLIGNSTGISFEQKTIVTEIIIDAHDDWMSHCAESSHNVEATLVSLTSTVKVMETKAAMVEVVNLCT